MNFHIFSAYNSEFQEKIRNCPNELENNSELSELTSEKNSEFRIKVGNYHPYSENIVRFGNYSKLARRKFLH